MIRLCGAALGFLAFAVTVLLGLVAGNPPETILGKAVGALFVFCLLGLATGWVANRVLDEHAVRKNREMFPEEPPPPTSTQPDGQQANESAAA